MGLLKAVLGVFDKSLFGRNISKPIKSIAFNTMKQHKNKGLVCPVCGGSVKLRVDTLSGDISQHASCNVCAQSFLITGKKECESG